ncbi:MAG: hypothetical protein ACRC80_08570 [Waterburya sp.]
MSFINDRLFCIAQQNELKSARTKFPDTYLGFFALIEEVGELATALLEYENGEIEWSNVADEAVQVAVMAQRIAVEGNKLAK